MALTPAQEEFAAAVARRTGLERPTVRAWVAIEGGPDDNPLNIASWADGRRYFRGFGSTEKAVETTVRLLYTKTYAPVLDVARDPRKSVRDELWAIIDSPWEETNYTYQGVRGARLIGTYASLYPRAPSVSSPGSSTTSATPAAVTSGTPVFNPLDPFNLRPDWWPIPTPDVEIDPAGWVGGIATWLGEKAGLALLYVVLTIAAAALILLGLMRATGTSRPSLPTLRRPADDIPF